MRTALIFIIILILLALGAGAFYFVSYQPKQYAQAVLEFYETSGDDYQSLFGGGLKEAYDYKGGLEILEQRKLTLTEFESEISKFNPPLLGSSKRLQPELDGFAADLKELVSEAQNSMTFLRKAAAFQELFNPGQNAFPNPNTATMGDLARYLDRKIPEIKDRGAELFEGPAPQLTDPQDFEKLQSSWQETAPALATMRSMAHRLDPTVSLSSFPTSLLTPPELTASKKMENFQRLLRETLRTNSANDILLYGFLTTPGAVPPQIAERSERIGKAISELHEKYDK